MQVRKKNGDGGDWLLRSPLHFTGDYVLKVRSDGYADNTCISDVSFTKQGIVPALYVSVKSE